MEAFRFALGEESGQAGGAIFQFRLAATGDDFVGGVAIVVGFAFNAIGGEAPVVAQQAAVDGDAGGGGGGVVVGAGDEVRAPSLAFGHAAFRGAHHHLAAAGVHLPENHAERVAGGVLAHFDAVAFGFGEGIREVVAFGHAGGRGHLGEHAAIGEHAEHHLFGMAPGDFGEAEEVANGKASDDALDDAAAGRGSHFDHVGAVAFQFYAGGRFAASIVHPLPIDYGEWNPLRAAQAVAGGLGDAGIEIEFAGSGGLAGAIEDDSGGEQGAQEEGDEHQGATETGDEENQVPNEDAVDPHGGGKEAQEGHASAGKWEEADDCQHPRTEEPPPDSPERRRDAACDSTNCCCRSNRHSPRGFPSPLMVANQTKTAKSPKAASPSFSRLGWITSGDES